MAWVSGPQWAIDMFNALKTPVHLTDMEREERRQVVKEEDRQAAHVRFRQRLEKVV